VCKAETNREGLLVSLGWWTRATEGRGTKRWVTGEAANDRLADGGGATGVHLSGGGLNLGVVVSGRAAVGATSPRPDPSLTYILFGLGQHRRNNQNWPTFALDYAVHYDLMGQ
jgi:hypothetical protein